MTGLDLTAPVPEPLRSALACYLWSGLDRGADLSRETELGLADPAHWTALLAHQATEAICGRDAELQRAVAQLAGEHLPVEGWDSTHGPRLLDESDLATRVAVAASSLVARLTMRHPLVRALPKDGSVLRMDWGVLAIKEPWPAPRRAQLPDAAALLPPRLYVCEVQAMAAVWPTAQQLPGVLDPPYVQPGRDRVPRLAVTAVAAAHLAGIIDRDALLIDLQHRPDRAHPCLVDLAYEGFTNDLDRLRAWHGLPPGDPVRYAVEWARHKHWWLLGQDEDLVALDDLGIDNVRVALHDPGCVKSDYIEDMLDHINASCGSPGCLSHSPVDDEEEDD
ncbi:MAG: hypothetical protein QOI82_1860 [Actinomycetota bacterium]|nr:hypothetical protein [Actinomycetota bacterium]